MGYEEPCENSSQIKRGKTNKPDPERTVELSEGRQILSVVSVVSFLCSGPHQSPVLRKRGLTVSTRTVSISSLKCEVIYNSALQCF
jgi:hypothetical protein